MKSTGVDACEEQQDAQSRERHRLHCRVIELEAVLREVTEYADLVGSETDDVHVAVIRRARETLAPGATGEKR